MKGVCRANKRNGEPCTLPVNDSNGYCWAHSPEHAEQRRRAASKAGRSKPNQLLLDVEEQFQSIADGVLAGTVDVRRGTAAVQALQGKVRAREVGRKIYESEVLEERLSDLEQRANQQRRGRFA